MKFVNSLEWEYKREALYRRFAKVRESGAYTEGGQTSEAEGSLTLMWARPSLVFANCGAALFTIFSFLKAKHGVDKAIVQNNTFYATGAMAVEAGLSVHLCDSRTDCPSMSVESLREAHKEIGGRPVVVLTHVGGWLAKDYREIGKYCQEQGLLLVEDCAHAIGVMSDRLVAGDLAFASAWSFYPTKALPVGEGGALSSKSYDLLRFAQEFRSYGKYRDAQQVIRYSRGFNLRMSEWDAAVLNVQLEALPLVIAKRREDARKLQSIAPCLLEGPSNFYKYPVHVDHARGLRTVGKVYSLSDQLREAMFGRVEQPVPLRNSKTWARAHECLPIGEGLYEDLETPEIRKLLEIA